MFNLNIWRHDTDCTVQLAWGERQQLSASLRYPPQLIHSYQNWQQCYRNAYPVLTRGRGEDFSFTPAAMDWKHETEKAEKKLLDTFKQWLGGEELLAIRRKIQQEAQKSNAAVELLVACDSIDLVRLPWETWQLVENLHISRTLLVDAGEESALVEPKPRKGAPRILVILGNSSELNLQEDRKILRVLQKVAKVEYIQFERRQRPEGRGQKEKEPDSFERRQRAEGRGQKGKEQESDSPTTHHPPPTTHHPPPNTYHLPPTTHHLITEFRQQINDAIADERGWDMLIFAGHSQEMKLTGGTIELAPQVFLSISEIESALLQAKERGLQVAIFNSCSGLSIAESLIKLGCPQVLVMREPIHDGVAQVFLKQLCQSLVAYRNLQQAMWDACRYCESEKLSYPSAYLIPSLFRHPEFQRECFQFEPSHWKRWWQDWQPSRREAIAFGATVFISLVFPVQELLFELRTFTQAFYRDFTHQLPSNPQPPVLLVSVDQESLDQAKEKIKEFETKPIDREYLRNLVNRLRELKVKTAGIDYILDESEPKQELLTTAISDTVTKVGTWFVLAVNHSKQLKVFPIDKMNWSFGGDIEFFSWDVQFPEDATCTKKCPFAYSLALAHTLNQKDNLPRKLQPRLENKGEFQQEVSAYLQEEPQLIASLAKQVNFPLGLRSIIDFSLPRQQIYQQVSAKDFFTDTFPQIQEQVVIIAAGGYDKAEDTFSMPLALRYWCRVENSPPKYNSPCHGVFTGGEAHAYMVHHLLSQHQVRVIPHWWVIGITALLGKGATLLLLQQPQQQRRQWGQRLVIVTAISGIVSLQVYISNLLLIPWLLPSVVFIVYLTPVLKKKIHA
ncbi:MAG: CHASE2 domain-containing protein [Symploca sp. SIO2D2]|nr:CHASE2 domain-containing protein [Symploca sp. SIO2D2]